MKSLNDLTNIPINNYSIKDSPYTAEITRDQPTAFVFLIDQSGSMGWDKLQHSGELKTKAEIVTNMINKTLSELINRCVRDDGIRDYFQVAMIGYGGKSASACNYLWRGNLDGKKWVNISELRDSAQYSEQTVVKNIRGKTKVSQVSVPYWIEPAANFQTPMFDAIKETFILINNWINDGHENCFPPTVINITDGVYSDATREEILSASESLKKLHTKDGRVLFMNCHISDDQSEKVVFPTNQHDLNDSDSYCHDLFKMSSVMPVIFNNRINDEIKKQNDVATKYVGMGYNSSMDDLLTLIDIGTTQTR